MAEPTPPPTGGAKPAGEAADPSMDDILASIRRILSEDEAGAQPPPAADVPHPVPPLHDVLLLDEDMMVPEPAVPAPAPVPAPVPAVPLPGEPLVAAATAQAAASSLGALVRTVAKERSVSVHRGGPTIEEMVREEIRPILKDWLDANLPPLVERLVRAEIERVVGQANS